MKKPILHEYMFNNKIAFYYARPDEVAIMKKIDIKHLDTIKDIIKQNKLKYRIRYRGPSTSTYKRNPSYALMSNATNFAIYNK
jgi:hypothetical protein